MNQPRRRPGRVPGLITTLSLVMLAALTAPTPGRAQPATPAGARPFDSIVGVWQGTTLAGCTVSLLPDRCNAQQKVSITLIEGENSKLTGSYKCAYGNQDCFHMDETGKVIEATLKGREIMIRVITPSALSYIFSGRITGDSVNGGYSCYSGGALLERGTWLARRSY